MRCAVVEITIWPSKTHLVALIISLAVFSQASRLEQLGHSSATQTQTDGGFAMSVTRALLLGPLVTTIVIWPSPALYAQDLEFRVGPGGVGIYDRNQERRVRERCNPDDALDLARDAGFRRPQIARVTSRSVVVEGFTRAGPDRIVFGNSRGCPEIG
jgi:hypothetical protein